MSVFGIACRPFQEEPQAIELATASPELGSGPEPRDIGSYVPTDNRWRPTLLFVDKGRRGPAGTPGLPAKIGERQITD